MLNTFDYFFTKGDVNYVLEMNPSIGEIDTPLAYIIGSYGIYHFRRYRKWNFLILDRVMNF